MTNSQRVRVYACLGFCLAAVSISAAPNLQVTAAVYFSPQGGCTEAVVDALNHATNQVLVQAYSFTSKPIAEALVHAFKRGVKVQVILDKSNRTEKYSAADFISRTGIPTLIDAQHEIAHNKVMIIDDEMVITGSFNFTKNAEEHNAENLLLLRSKELAAEYAEKWREHEQHSDPYEGDAKAPKKDSHTKRNSP